MALSISFQRAFATLLLVAFMLAPASAASVGHSAPSISAGTFEAGNFVFPNNLTVGGTNFFVNNGTGYIGIGTLSPSQRLDIFGNLRTQGYGNFSGTVYINNGTDIQTLVSGNISAADDWNVSGTLLFPKDLGYAVGIGTNNPSTRLDVAGNIKTTGTNYKFIAGSNYGFVQAPMVSETSWMRLHVGSLSAWDDINKNWTITQGGGGDFAGIDFLNTQGISFVVGSTGSTTIAGINLTNANYSSYERMRISSNGNVGIGTSNPTQRLDVNGIVNASGYLVNGSALVTGSNVSGTYVPYSGATTNVNLGVYNLTTSGMVGIGTASPESNLHIIGGAGGATSLATAVTKAALKIEYASNPGVSLSIGFINSGGGAYQYIQPSNNGTAAYHLALNPYGGNVGIGTSSPTQRLDVRGNGNFSGTIYINNNTDIQTLVSGNISAADDWNLSGNNLFPKSLNYRIGLGTTSPNASLEIRSVDTVSNSTILLTENEVHGTYLRYDGTGNVFSIGNLANGAQSDVISLPRDSNYVGIGTTSPAAKLDVRGGSVFIRANPAGAHYLNITGIDGSGTFITDNYGWIRFKTGSGAAYDSLYLGATGNVGIGTTTPSQKLDVRGAGNFSGTVYINNGTDIKAYVDALNVSSSGNETATYVPYSGASKNVNLGANNFTISGNGRIAVGSVSAAHGSIEVSPSSGGGNVTGVVINTNSATTGTEARLGFYMSSNQDQETIGTSFLTAARSGANGMADLYLAPANNGGVAVERLRVVGSSGYVGIGTSNPSANLEISGGASQTLKLNNTAGSNLILASGASVPSITSSGALNIIATGASKISLQSGSVERLVVDTTGNVGIGTATPSRTLDVRGDGNFSGTVYINNNTDIQTLVSGNISAADDWNLSGSNLFPKSLAYNIGIGTAAPGYKLDVNGSFNVAGNATILGNLKANILSTNRNAFGLERNILFNGYYRYNVTQSGPASISLTMPFDGEYEPSYSSGSPTDIDPQVILIENLPSDHTQAAAWVGWTTRYWAPKRFKIEGYDTYSGYNNWRTLADYSAVDYSDSDFMVQVIPGGQYTKLRYTVYKGGENSTGGRFGFSEIFFIHPEATRPYGGLLPTTLYEGASGRVGLGTANPNAKLEIAGGLNVSNGASFATTSGNVGIGTANPSSKLEVAGNLNVTGNISFAYGNALTNPSVAYQTVLKTGWDGSQDYTYIYTAGTTASNAAPKISILRDGNVGIGTTTPSRALDVRGAGNFSGTVYINNGTDISTLVAGSDDWNVSGSNLFPKDLAYNIGLGITSPTARLHINQTASATGFYVEGGINGNDLAHFARRSGATADINISGHSGEPQIIFGTGTGSKYAAGYDTAGGFQIAEGADLAEGTSRFYIKDSTGYVGIGTTNPGANLEVNSSTTGSIVIRGDGTGGPARQAILYLKSTSNEQRGRGIIIGNNTNDQWFAGSPYLGNAFQIGYHPTQPEYTANSLFYLTSTGNLGLGTASPSQRLDVRGDGNFSGTVYVNNGTDVLSLVSAVNASSSTWNVSGSSIYPRDLGYKVGINTTSPSQSLTVVGSTTAPILNSASVTNASLLISNADPAYGTFFATLGSGTGIIQQRRQSAATYYDLALNPHGGNVGIGTLTPSQKLDVSGNIALVGAANRQIVMNTSSDTASQLDFDFSPTLSTQSGLFRFFRSTNTTGTTGLSVYKSDGTNSENSRLGGNGNTFLNALAGNVGVNTTSPASTLQVQGTFNASNTNGGMRLDSSGNVWIGI